MESENRKALLRVRVQVLKGLLSEVDACGTTSKLQLVQLNDTIVLAGLLLANSEELYNLVKEGLGKGEV